MRSDKEKYESLLNKYEAYVEELRKKGQEVFFNKYIVKYASIAEDKEWVIFSNRHVFTEEQNIILRNRREEFHHFQNTIYIPDADEFEEDFERFVKGSQDYKLMRGFNYECNYQIEHDEEIQTAKCQMSELISKLQYKKFNIATYRLSTDLIYTLKDFLKSNDENIVFQSYLLRGQLYVDELERFLCLFEDYILHIKQIQIKVEHFRIAEGIVFIIRSGDEKIAKENFNDSVQNFAEFLNICDYDVDMAKSLLKRENSKIKDIEIDYIIQRYSIEARRLKLDIKHEYERRVLDVKQRFENDILLGNEDSQIDEIIREKAVNNLPVLLQQYNAPIYINSGTINYNENDVQLEELFKKYSETEERYAELIQQLNMLKDKGIVREYREGIFNKIKRFFDDHSVEIAGQTVSILLEYITFLLG